MRTRIIVFTLCLAAFLCMNGVGMAVSSLPARLLALSGSVRSSAWLASSFAISYLLVQLPSGRLVDRLGVRPMLALGLLLMAGSGLCYFRAQSPADVFLGRLLQGAGEAPVWAAAPALLSRLQVGSGGRWIGLYGLSFQLGLTMGPSVGLALGAPFLGLTVTCLVSALAVALLVREPAANPLHIDRHADRAANQPACPTIDQRDDQRDCRHTDQRADQCAPHTGRRGLRPLLIPLGILLSGGGYALMISLIPAFLMQARGFGQSEVGLCFTLGYLGFGLGQYGAGRLSDRLGRSGFMVWGLALGGVVLAPFGLLGSGLFWSWSAMAALFVAGLGLGAFTTASLAGQCEAAPADRRGRASGRWFLWWGLGYFVVPQGVGLLEAGPGCAALGGLLLATGFGLALTRKT